ncbi:MAG: dimethylarginine dimethylaminohydrolase family protein [Rhizobiaceae bacterium]
MTNFGANAMNAPLRNVIMRKPDQVMKHADPKKWHYGPTFNPDKAALQHAAFTKLIEQSGAQIHWLPDVTDDLSDSIFTRDPSIIASAGAVIFNMGKALRISEPALHAATLQSLNVPILGTINHPGTIEGGDTIWLDAKTLVVGRGIRTNQDGIDQLSAILKPHGISVISFDLPLWDGEAACLHLMSMISPLADDLYLVHAPLLPVALYQLMKARDIQLIIAPADEFTASNGLSLNVLPTSPRKVIMVDGFPKTKAAMEAAGCVVDTFEADALCIACEGGPTCLTGPVWRA